MKFHFPTLWTFAIAVFFTFSCTKNSNNNAMPPRGPLYQDSSTILVGLFVIDSTLPSPKDTVTRVSFSYDNLGRLSEATTLSLDSNGENQSTMIKQFDYNGSDRFASRLIRTFISSLNEKSLDTSYYSYLNDKCIRDSFLSSAFSSITKFTYQPSGTIESTNRSFLIPGSDTFTDSSKIYLKVFIDKTGQIDTLIRHINTSSVSQYYVTETAMSDMYISANPFYQLNPVKKEYFTDMGNGPYADAGYVPQKLITEQWFSRKTWSSNNPEKVESIRDERISYGYILRPNRYPLVAWAHIYTPTSHRVQKMLFIYKD
jgi:hypothetical protein